MEKDEGCARVAGRSGRGWSGMADKDERKQGERGEGRGEAGRAEAKRGRSGVGRQSEEGRASGSKARTVGRGDPGEETRAREPGRPNGLAQPGEHETGPVLSPRSQPSFSAHVLGSRSLLCAARCAVPVGEEHGKRRKVHGVGQDGQCGERGRLLVSDVSIAPVRREDKVDGAHYDGPGRNKRSHTGGVRRRRGWERAA